MPIFRIVLLSVFYLSMITISTSCGSSNTQTDEPSEMEQPQTKAYTAAYVCPMHCEGSGSEEPGKCPVCDMAYVKNLDHHDHDHDGHDHDGHDH
ncbi:MAG: hypothetical protein HKN87_23445 [Saprospiraceae bacterium]|nr:hypothetical protein [Saprospiraceae bacterium]